MVPVAVASAMVAPLGFESVTVKVSSSSATVSLAMATVNSALVSPAAKVSAWVLCV